MSFHSDVAAPGTPLLLELDDNGLATFDDGSTLQFPKGVTFTPEHNPIPTKFVLLCKVTRKDGDKDIDVDSCRILRGATKSATEAAIRRCELAVERAKLPPHPLTISPPQMPG